MLLRIDLLLGFDLCGVCLTLALGLLAGDLGDLRVVRGALGQGGLKDRRVGGDADDFAKSFDELKSSILKTIHKNGKQ